MSATIRIAFPLDADDIASVHVRSWRVAYRDLLPEGARDGFPLERRQAMWRRIIADTAPHQTVWVAEDGDRVIGFANAGGSRDDGAPAGTGEVYSMYVDPDDAGTGVGLMLMEHATQYLRTRFQRATLWTFRDNAPARQFYEQAGWTFDGSEQAIAIGDFQAIEVRYAIELAD